MGNNVVGTDSPIIQFKDEEMHYCFCDSVDTWRFDKNPENVFDVTEAECAEIEFINIHSATRFETLEDLKYLKNLKRLWMYPLPRPEDIVERREKMKAHSAELVAELAEILPQLPQLEELYIGPDMTVRNLSFLQNVNGLKKLSIVCGMEDISGIGDHPMLEDVSFGLGSITDISPIQELRELKDLGFANNQVEDLTPLQSMENLRRLFISNNNISDITPLLGLKKLYLIQIFGNPVCEDEEQMRLLREAFPGANIVTVDPRSEEAGK